MDASQRVIIVPSDHAAWRSDFDLMAASIGEALPGVLVEHIGSTAVPELPGKDVVDLMIGVPPEEMSAVEDKLRSTGWDLEGTRGHHSWLSWPSRSNRRFIAHVVHHPSSTWSRRIDFRDLLRADPSAREEYLAMKLAAAAESSNWDDYTQAKTEVVSKLLGSVNNGRLAD